MKKDPTVFLQHILECIEHIEKYIKARTFKHFVQSPQLQDAVIRRLEILGEAAKNIPGDFRKRYRDIPWRKMAGMRDKLIHEYFGISLKLAWVVIKKHLPILKVKIKTILKNN